MQTLSYRHVVKLNCCMTEHDRAWLHNFKTKFLLLFQGEKSFNILIRYSVAFSLRIRMGLLKLLVCRATLFVVFNSNYCLASKIKFDYISVI